MRFKGKKVLVTGGTRGIGAACVKAFLAEGAQVASQWPNRKLGFQSPTRLHNRV